MGFSTGREKKWSVEQMQMQMQIREGAATWPMNGVFPAPINHGLLDLQAWAWAWA
jgi:hypothetical protein